MAPKSARDKSDTAITDDNAQNDNTDKYYWSGRPLDKPPWFYNNRKSLYDDVPGSERFIETGVVRTSRSQLAVYSIAHAQAHAPWPYGCVHRDMHDIILETSI